MTFIIAAGTIVTGFDHIQSISLNLSPQIQRLYVLGTNPLYNRIIINQHSLNVAVYAGGGNTYDTRPSTDCNDANSKNISISAHGCGSGPSISFSDTMYVASYSYNKDVQGFGSENWSLITKPVPDDGTANNIRMIRGVAEGQASTGGADTGVDFSSIAATGQTMDVSAGSPGIGKAFNMEFGEVIRVGNGLLKQDGKDGTASVSIPYTPIYLT
jgi:hypothetical protein